MKALRIGIAGFGVAGAAAATLLARGGHRVTVLEQTPVLGPVGAGLLLQPSGQAVLKRMGLLDAVVANAEPISELVADTHRGRRLSHIRYADWRPGALAYGVHRAELFDVLRDSADRAGVELRTNVIVQGVERRDGATFILGHDREPHGPFDLVIASDGRRSRVRAAVGARCLSHTYRQAAVWTVGPCAAIRGRLYQVARGTRQLLGMLPLGGGRCSLFRLLPRGVTSCDAGFDFDGWKREVIALCPAAEELIAAVASPAALRVGAYGAVWLPRWRDRAGQVAFAGDAAHAMGPHLGQGANLALLDAWALAASIETAADLASALADYERSRRRHVWYYTWLSLALVPFFQSRGFVRSAGRDVVLPRMSRWRWSRKLMAASVAGLRDGLFGTDLSI